MRRIRGPVWILLRSLGASAWGNLGLGALALVLALALWAFVTNEENPTRSDRFPFAIPVEPVNVPSNLAVFGPIEPVTLRVSAPEDTWEDFQVEDFRAVLDLSGSDAGTLRLPVRVDYTGGRRGVRVQEVTPDTVEVTLEPLVTRTVPVRVDVSAPPPLEFQYTVQQPDPAFVTIAGPEEVVQLVDEAVAEVNLSQVTASLDREFPVVARSARGFAVDGVSVEPAAVRVQIAVVQALFQRAFLVVPTVTGEPAPGFAIVGVVVQPATVTVMAPLSVLQSVESLATQPVDVAGADADQQVTVEVTVPAGAEVVGLGLVTVRVTIAPLQGQALIAVAPEFENVGAELQPSSATQIILVTVTGPVAALQALQPGDVRAFVDLQGLGRGTHTVEVRVAVPPGLVASRSEPAEITVTLQ